MPLIETSNVIENARGYGAPILNAGAPVAGTTEVQTLTIGGTPTAGTFTISWNGHTTGAITWNATNSTLLSSINTALDALANLENGDLVATAGTLTAGIGTILLTFSANEVKKAQNLATVTSSLTGASPTAVITRTTTGVTATQRGLGIGAQLIDTTNAFLYINTGTAVAPVFTKVGAQI